MNKKTVVLVCIIIVVVIFCIIGVIVLMGNLTNSKNGSNNNTTNQVTTRTNENISNRISSSNTYNQNTTNTTQNLITNTQINTITNTTEPRNTVNNSSTPVSYANKSQEEIVQIAIQQYYTTNFQNVVEGIEFKSIKILSRDEINQNEQLRKRDISVKDIVFQATYDLKISKSYDRIGKFAAGNGNIEGQWIRNKYSSGIVKFKSENNYAIEEGLGTSF